MPGVRMLQVLLGAPKYRTHGYAIQSHGSFNPLVVGSIPTWPTTITKSPHPQPLRLNETARHALIARRLSPCHLGPAHNAHQSLLHVAAQGFTPALKHRYLGVGHGQRAPRPDDLTAGNQLLTVGRRH